MIEAPAWVHDVLLVGGIGVAAICLIEMVWPIDKILRSGEEDQ